MSELLKKFVFSYVFDSFSPGYALEQIAPVALRSCRSLQKRDRERFTQVAHDKRATGAIHERIALLLTKNERIAGKIDEGIPNPELQYCSMHTRYSK